MILAKPQTNMNLSGVSVRMLLERYEVDPAEMIVLVDDVDLPWGNSADSRTRLRRNAQRAEVDHQLDRHAGIYSHPVGRGAGKNMGRPSRLCAPSHEPSGARDRRARWWPMRWKQSK